MKETQAIKNALYETCRQHIEQRIEGIRQRLSALAESKRNETKSSVGDKYETGRAMLQIEEQNSHVQLAQALEVKQRLASVKPDKTCEQVEPGSLVITNKGNYFVAIGIGKVVLESKRYFCISMDSPIGLRLRGKKNGEEIVFNENTIVIEEVG